MSSLASETDEQQYWYDQSAGQLSKKAQGGKVSYKKTVSKAKQALAEAKARTADLATSSDRTGISFAGAAFQSEYYLSKFKRRGMLCHRVLEEYVGAMYTKHPPPTPLTSNDWKMNLAMLYINQGDPVGKDGVTLKSSETNVKKVLTKYLGREMILFRELFRRYKVTIEQQKEYNLPLQHCVLGNIPSFRERVAAATTTSTTTPLQVKVASFGGGPGTDAAGLVWLSKNHPEIVFDCVLYDSETSWKRYIKTLNQVFGDNVNCSFQQCDVTTPLPKNAMDDNDNDNDDGKAVENEETHDYSVYVPHDVNTHCGEYMSSFDILLFMYVVHETSKTAEENGYSFYKGVAQNVQDGTIMIICDVMEKSRRDMDKVIDAMRTVREIEIIIEKRSDDTVRNATESSVFVFGKLL